MESIPRFITHISEVLYMGMCVRIGTPTQVKIRRDVTDTMELTRKPVEVQRGFRVMESGSGREGFRLETSDRDIMIWSINDIVTCDLSQIPPYHPSTQTLILMECHDTPPGFAKLKLLTPPKNTLIRYSSVRVNDQVYISSRLYREIAKSLLQMNPLHQSSKVHGPCTNGYLDVLEYDLAYCFSSTKWPFSAYHWIDRCQKHGWPSPHVLHNIVSDGCHLVAIASGRSTSPQQCETEWRLSFSQAEYTLVNSMNHTQFLCYGVLKFFLKEVLNVRLEDPLLCSYFLKTTLFWKIQENKISGWCSKNLLYCVWVCFKYLIKCVYRGEFPNFFIPQNNMFKDKIHGVAQNQLFQQLMTLYNMGFSCLLLSPSLYKILTNSILYQQIQVSTDENNIISEVELDMEVFIELHKIIGYINTNVKDKLLDSLAFVMATDHLYKTIPSPNSQSRIVTLNAMRTMSLVRAAFCLDKSREDNGMHTTDSYRLLETLISATESGFISDVLYVAIHLYNKNRYTEALHYTERAKQKLSQPYVLNIGTQYVNRERYMDAVGGQSLIDKVKQAVSCDIIIDEVFCIDELRLEVHVSKQNGMTFLYVPPLVMTYTLLFLCHHHLGDRLRSRQSLDKLKNLLHCHGGQYIMSFHRDISWQMLGICEQIYGNKEMSLHCYQQSFKQLCYHKINTASWTRMENVLLRN